MRLLFKEEKGEEKGREGEERQKGKIKEEPGSSTHLSPSAKQKTFGTIISWAHSDQGKVPYLTF